MSEEYDVVFHEGAVREIPTSREYPIHGTILLIGEDNPQSRHPAHALVNYPAGCAGHRLQEQILGIVPEEYLAIWRTNLCSPTWSQAMARQRFAVLMEMPDAPWTRVVCLGRKVSQIAEEWTTRTSGIGVGFQLRPFGTATCGRVMLASLPHPSGRCREWNDPRSYDRAATTMRQIAPGIAWGGKQ